MPEYTLRNVDPSLWSRFTERANREGWPIKPLFVELMDSYASGEFTPCAAPPRELPEYAWLRSHYKALAQTTGFTAADAQVQWELLVRRIVDSAAGMSYLLLDNVPISKRAKILRWLDRTSNLEVRHSLTLRAIAHIGEGPDLRTNRRAFQYEVLGLPPAQQAWVADYKGGWRLLRVINGKQGDWEGPHETKDDALETLARTLEHEARTSDEIETVQLKSWSAVILAIRRLAIPLGQERGVPIGAVAESQADDGSRRFTIMAAKGAFVMRLLPDHAVECHWQIATGNAWYCRYQIESDGSWSGPFAKGAQSRHFVDVNAIAREIIDAWIVEVVPHH